MTVNTNSIRPFHFKRGDRVQCSVPHDPWSIFSQLDGLSASVECESTTLPGYYHVRFRTEPGGAELWLVPWQYLLLLPGVDSVPA